MLLVSAASAILFGTFVLALSPYGPRATGIALLLGGVMAVPFAVVGDSQSWHVGIAGAGPAISTFTLGVLAAVLMQRWSDTRLAWRLIAPAGLWIGIGTFGFWGGSDEVVAGSILLVTGLLAFATGTAFGRHFDRDSRPAVLMAVVLCTLVLLQVLIATLQQAGLDVAGRPEAPGEAFRTGRASGTLGHANNLGKAMVLAMVMSLPLTRSAIKTCRRLAMLTVFLAIAALGISQGRANGAAAMAMIVLWVVLTPANVARVGRWLLPLAASSITLAFIGPIIDRFASDPFGGSRSHFTGVALREIPNHLLLGVGPNAYVTVVGRTDRLTAEGWPVHNTFLLGIAELGAIGAACLFLPWLFTTARAARAVRRSGADGDFARAQIAALPGILAIANTGWAMMHQNSFVFWMLATGVILGQIGRGAQDTSDSARHRAVEPSPSPRARLSGRSGAGVPSR